MILCRVFVRSTILHTGMHLNISFAVCDCHFIMVLIVEPLMGGHSGVGPGARASVSPPAPPAPVQLTFGASCNGMTHGLADFVAQEEMDRYRGFWWSLDSSSIAFTEVIVGYVGSPCKAQSFRYWGSRLVPQGKPEHDRCLGHKGP